MQPFVTTILLNDFHTKNQKDTIVHEADPLVDVSLCLCCYGNRLSHRTKWIPAKRKKECGCSRQKKKVEEEEGDINRFSSFFLMTVTSISSGRVFVCQDGSPRQPIENCFLHLIWTIGWSYCNIPKKWLIMGETITKSCRNTIQESLAKHQLPFLSYNTSHTENILL